MTKCTRPSPGWFWKGVFEPGEIVSAGATLVTVGDLDALTLTVYVPEDRYGQIMLGQVCQVNVDSYPGQNFSGTVIHIADQAEFTPRNVPNHRQPQKYSFCDQIKPDPSPAESSNRACRPMFILKLVNNQTETSCLTR